jgi:hypothetical protein
MLMDLKVNPYKVSLSEVKVKFSMFDYNISLRTLLLSNFEMEIHDVIIVTPLKFSLQK